MTYRMFMPAFDNSDVNTRQVRRQRARLAAKGRSEPRFDGNVRVAVFGSSRYRPHNGKREMARRVRQLAAA